MILPDWLYSKPRPLTFPVWLLKGDIIEIDGESHRFRGLARRFKELDEVRQYFGIVPASAVCQRK